MSEDKNIHDLVPDIYKLFDPNESHYVDEANLSQFGEDVKEIVRKRLLEREEGGSPLRFSALGKPDRQIWLNDRAEKKEQMRPENYFKFLYGDVIEALVLFLAKESGHSVSDEQAEVECEGVLGHIDAIIDNVVVDVKSAAPYSFAKFVNGQYVSDLFSKQYLNQLCGYSNVLTPDKAPAFLAFDKVAGKLALVPVSVSVAKDYKPDERIKHLKEVLASDQIPERCYEDEADGKSGNRKLGLGCSYCPHKRKCWPGLRKFVYSNGPRYLTVVAKTPEVWEDVKFSVDDEDTDSL